MMDTGQFLNVGIILMLLGSLIAYLRWVPRAMLMLVMRRFFVTVEIHDHDPAFRWLKAWMNKHIAEKQSCGQWTIMTCTVGKSGQSWESSANEEAPEGGKRKTKLTYSLAPGWHVTRSRGARVIIQRLRRDLENAQSGESGYVEHFVIRICGAKGRDVIQGMLEQGRQLVDGSTNRRFQVWLGNYSRWEALASCEPRPLESIMLSDDIMTNVIEDTRRFMRSEEWYRSRGIPYRRGFLLHGPPGNGKSSLVSAIAGIFGMDVYIVPLSSRWMDDTHLAELMRNVPEGGIILMEDIDCVFDDSRVNRKDSNMTVLEKRPNSITLSGLLNVIDGVAAPEGHVLFMTTNNPESVDEALLRPGRIDRRWELNNATPKQAARLFTYFYQDSDVTDDDARSFADSLTNGHISMAALQGIMLKEPDDPMAAIKNLTNQT